MNLSLPAVGNAEGHGLRVGDKLLEVNGCSVRGFSHQQAGALFTESSGGKVSLLVYSVKPSPCSNSLLLSFLSILFVSHHVITDCVCMT